MGLSAGTRLGPYEILSLLGAGGMGEVYRARDTRLERTVAIKVLPSGLASAPEVRQRFEREAKTISQLSHPHICALYDVGRDGETEYLVMEYLEGETLAERLMHGALPLEQALRCGIEIADALEKAHRQEIVHRDLKPGNVMLTNSGVKLLDFGLAKSLERSPDATRGHSATDDPESSNDATALPTVVGSLTQAGTILGTFQYMAPEQLEGKQTDARTDIFALGAVLYEMATGRKAFRGSSQASLVGAILHVDPPAIASLQPMSPAALDRVVKKSLAKDPEQRWQNAADFGSELKWIAEGTAAEAVAAAVRPSRRRLDTFAWVGLAIAGLSALILAALLRQATRPREVRPVRAFIPAPEKTAFRFSFAGGPPALSPDGTKLVFATTTSDGNSLLWVRPLDSLAARPLSGTEGAAYPFWSPDGRYIGYFQEDRLKKIEASGGPSVTLAEAPEGGRGGSWNREDTIIFTGRYTPVYRVSADGGNAAAVTRFDPQRRDTTHRWPVFLPDGRRFLYLASEAGSQGDRDAVFLGSLDGKENRLLLPASSNVAVASGYLLVIRDSMLMAQPFDARTGTLHGEAVLIAEQVQYDSIFSRGMFSVSDNGVLAYQSGAATADAELVWYGRDGKVLGALAEVLQYLSPRLSPDGRRVGFSIVEPRRANEDLWIHDLERGIKTRFTFNPGRNFEPIWSPDSRRIAFARFAKDTKSFSQIYVKNSDGSGPEEALLKSDAMDLPTDWSADGKYLAFTRIERPGTTHEDIWILPLEGDRKPFPFLRSPFSEDWAEFSPDGRWIAYQSNESGRAEVYVAPFPGPGGKFQISTSGGKFPRWRRDGREIFYVSRDLNLMAAAVETDAGFRAGAVRALFPVHSRGRGIVYDVAADGQKFLIVNPKAEEGSPPITLVIHWTADLRR